MTSQDEKRFLHVQRASAVRHDELEIGKIDGDVVELQRIPVLRARPGKDRGAGVNHHRQAALFAPPVNLGERRETVGIGVGGKRLMGRVDLEQPDAEIDQAVDVAAGVLREARVHTAVGNQPLRVRARVARREGVRRIIEAHDVGTGVIHEPHAPHARAIHHLEQGARIVHDGDQEAPMIFLPPAHRLLDFGLEVAPRLNVDVDVSDPAQSLQV